MTPIQNDQNDNPIVQDEHTPKFVIERNYGTIFWLSLFLFVLFVYLIASSNIVNDCKSCKNEFLFNTSAARVHLKTVTGFGPRTAGSIANEIKAVEYLKKELQHIADVANSRGIFTVLEHQISKYSSIRKYSLVGTYNNIQNLILRFHTDGIERNTSSNGAFLVNCHFDSAISSPGASDAFVNCAVMLEVCRTFAVGNFELYNDLIFMFNGAEESILLASHAFITQHHWASDVRAFINLEGAGAGKRLMAFQFGPGDGTQMLLETFAKSFSQPLATVVGEDLFQSGLIPSDTDFRIFRDYGLIPGIDLAYIDDAYVYHTENDVEARIKDTCIEQSGVNLMHFLISISADKRLQTLQDTILYSHRNQREVYFDFLGYYFFKLQWRFWKYINCFLILYFIVSLVLAYRARWYCLCIAVFVNLLIHLVGIGISYLCGLVLHNYGCRMSWYANHYNLIGVFMLPLFSWYVNAHTYLFTIPDGLIFRCLRLSCFMNKRVWHFDREVEHSVLLLDVINSSLFLLSIKFAILTWFNIPSSYFCTFWFCCLLSVRWASRGSASLLSKVICLFCVSITLLNHMYLAETLINFLIPIMGRSGQMNKPDVFISLLVFFLVYPVTLCLSGFWQCTSKRTAKILGLFLLIACLSHAILIHSTPYGFPYYMHRQNSSAELSSPRYQRVCAFHMNRYFRYESDSDSISETDSHLLVVPLDVNGIRYLTPDSYPASFSILKSQSKQNVLIELGVRELIDATPYICNRTQPYCGLAIPYPYLHLFLETYIIPAAHYNSNRNIELRLLSKTVVDTHKSPNKKTLWNCSFSVISGPPHTHAIIRVVNDYVQVYDWSVELSIWPPFPISIPSGHNDALDANDSHFFLYHLNAAAVADDGTTWSIPWMFSVIFEVENNITHDRAYFDIALTGMYFDEDLDSYESSSLRNFSERLPPWVTVMKGCSVYSHWRFSLVSE